MDSDLQTKLNAYITDLFAQEDDVLKWIQSETTRLDIPQMSIRPFEGRLLQLLIYLSGAKKVIEIGSLAGYSGVWLARALPVDGHLYTIEKNPKHADATRASFEKAGLSDRTTVYQGDALDMLDKLIPEGPFGLIFLDAMKVDNPKYLTWAVEHLSIGGVIAAHNSFRQGRIIAPETIHDHGMIEFHQMLIDEPRVEATIIGMGDGITVGVKRS